MTHQRPPFSPSGKFVVRREFRFAGRDFRLGEEFIWRRMACSPRKLRALYEGGHLMFKDEEAANQVVPATDGGGTGGKLDPATGGGGTGNLVAEGTPDETVTDEETGDEEPDDAEDAGEVVEKPKKKKKRKRSRGEDE